jgi:hypothetical protein
MDWDIELTHTPPETIGDRLAYNAVKAVRYVFDVSTGWQGEITPSKVMNRTIYLETIAAVPGMVAAIIRHFKSLRTMQRDGKQKLKVPFVAKRKSREYLTNRPVPQFQVA